MVSYVSETTYLPALRNAALNTEIEYRRSLTAAFYPNGHGATRWSHAIAERYRLQLTDELADWFDCGVCDALGGNEFCEPASPEQLIGEAPDCIWPGLMPPDVLPLVGNGIGDWLCGRVSDSNTIDEIIYWYHGGGDCLPYGGSLAEAILFDTLADRLPGRRQRHAIPAESKMSEYHSIVAGPLVQWSRRHLPSDVAEVLHIDAPPTLVASELIRHDIATDAVYCDAALAALDNAVRMRLTFDDAKKLNASWEKDCARWMFDTATIPADAKRWLLTQWDEADSSLFDQDWDAVQVVCQKVALQRSDLGWVHNCLGWVHQRRGEHETAKRHYEKAADALLFTDQAIRFRTDFDSERFGKFAIARLLELGGPNRLDQSYVDALSDVTRPDWQADVRRHWLRHADLTTVSPSKKYELTLRAGWDVGCESMTAYHGVLIQLSDAAVAAGQVARAEVARAHASCIEDRYGKPPESLPQS